MLRVLVRSADTGIYRFIAPYLEPAQMKCAIERGEKVLEEFE